MQFSGEELKELEGGTWENPAFDNMDQLMDERYDIVHTQYIHVHVMHVCAYMHPVSHKRDIISSSFALIQV